MSDNWVHIVGGGLAGSEAAWQALRQGCKVRLYEMRPKKLTPAHKTGLLAELVCSNSLKSLNEGSAPGLLKREMELLDSLVVKAAKEARVPAGQALAVDREQFSGIISKTLQNNPNFELVEDEVSSLPTEDELLKSGDCWIVSSGPLTSNDLSKELLKLCGEEDELHFYDAIAPVIEGDSINRSVVYSASRWQEGEGDYLNIPLNKDQYNAFVDEVIAAEKMPLHDFEDVKYFESCLPIEVMIERGRDTLRFGPMKPSGLNDPATGRWAYANIQLRMEDREGAMYSMVGFQTKMKWPEQKRIFRTLPGLENAEFFKLGSVHRNTYLNSPKVLTDDLSFKRNRRILLAGQITGVEGYTESAAMGLLAGRAAAAKVLGKAAAAMPPQETMMGSLLSHVVSGGRGDYSPMNANLGLLPTIPKKRGVSKADRKAEQCSRAFEKFQDFSSTI
ncbi:methylenetetrahydrofolate--tRNA-(uracil(54)-C(5))-methyltransferase (FADH(2)-oxidizing) TrmFO [Pseudobacteriovorax antillogorgiicola]|uniref:Methylenetetrahydrofolate--tRNA-(uracil-5-)-methyltransferase TrmFO n=1 Tax=Pseudobacteriovorax antillogorgiicola TaxID=1513793 RepID=A0A1Y6B3V6_9BACT|nr:methylenetetrahydrofolate--tRNA-(uracil(54)-C(5))-methyltransferase (FADH(2)-oxidizing) TrmFO [Pseudobacteriovorax antillogorgiicola]TCS59225.1 methylenetetrahydrofolate--tRNA-(uracil-5-)-methyltransferase [Pseudobacteriovorax antillogorgiicola]SME90364.1 methylenetetrahydrofolate--tRNA-(uracil-5-)-methyltransferase [Pseudobacteriovorax antillogorgiicola]